MKNTLRSIVMAAVAVTAIAAGTASAQAESSVKVPFAFKVGNQICPAGEYIVQEGYNHNLVILKSRDAKFGFTWVLTPGAPSPTSSRVLLKFDEIGATELLHSIQYRALETPAIDKGSKFLERPIARTIQGQ